MMHNSRILHHRGLILAGSAKGYRCAVPAPCRRSLPRKPFCVGWPRPPCSAHIGGRSSRSPGCRLPRCWRRSLPPQNRFASVGRGHCVWRILAAIVHGATVAAPSAIGTIAFPRKPILRRLGRGHCVWRILAAIVRRGPVAAPRAVSAIALPRKPVLRRISRGHRDSAADQRGYQNTSGQQFRKAHHPRHKVTNAGD